MVEVRKLLNNPLTPVVGPQHRLHKFYSTTCRVESLAPKHPTMSARLSCHMWISLSQFPGLCRHNQSKQLSQLNQAIRYNDIKYIPFITHSHTLPRINNKLVSYPAGISSTCFLHQSSACCTRRLSETLAMWRRTWTRFGLCLQRFLLFLLQRSKPS